MILRQSLLILLIIASILAFQVALANPVLGYGSPSPYASQDHQIDPTETPLAQNGEKVLTTSPALLQVIILLGILAVLIIFIGVWINRRTVNSR